LATQPKKIFEDVQEQQKGKNLNDLAKRLARFSKRYSFIKTLKKPAALIAGVYAFLFRGQPVKLNVFKDSELEIKSDLSKQKGEFNLSSPILTGSAKFVGKAPKERNPWLPEPDDALQKEERFAIGVARSIPLIDVKGTINYGTTTSNFTATFEKPLSSKISCALDIKRNFNYLNSEQKNSDETVRLMYNLNF
ncbi:MAG: hypothetical protein HY072_01920, partial [Deltaproteobacteria bacterium]|nr:hypothetical protein [Deltaproteobacteria bacterium]